MNSSRLLHCSNSLAQLNFNVYEDADELMLPLPSNIFAFVTGIRIYLNPIIVFF